MTKVEFCLVLLPILDRKRQSQNLERSDKKLKCLKGRMGIFVDKS